jgi:hypothetical protein
MIATETIAREASAAQPGDSVTVAVCNGDKLAAKTHGPSSSRSYDAGWLFAFRSMPATSVLDLFELISAAMAHPRLFVVHGEALVSRGRRFMPGGTASELPSAQSRLARFGSTSNPQTLLPSLM